MALLSIKERQKYLKELGYYTGKIDGIVGKLTKQAYIDLQSDYFTRKKDIDGIYGNDTDILLRNAYACKDLKYFKLSEFKCGCKTKYCTGYPAILDCDLLNYLDDLRSSIKKPCTITSGVRCKTHNKNVGGASGSRHTTGKAVDIVFKNYSDVQNRRTIVNKWIEDYKESRYAYTNGYGRTKSNTNYPISRTMGNATHVDVK